jgi:multidrug efflux system outer membrane protein
MQTPTQRTGSLLSPPLTALAVSCGLLVAGMAGCASHPAQRPPPIKVPAAWTAAPAASDGAPLTQDWFRAFGSPELDSLITSAYAENLDVQAADARLRQADARARAAGAALLPQIDAQGNATNFRGHSSAGSAVETDWTAGIAASYEIDFWGKKRAARESAVALRRASEADRALLMLSTVTSIADSYFQVLALREQIAFAQQTADNARRLLDLVLARADRGMANPAEVAQQRAAVAGTEIHVHELEQQEAAARAALAILVGKTPGAFDIAARDLAGLTAPRVAAGLPVELLARRPDVLSAEETLRSAHADLLQARAAFLPSLTLTGTAGLANPAVNAAINVLTGTGPSFTLTGNLVQTIFDGGRLRAARDEARAKEEEMIAHYRAAALAALWDVETALSDIGSLDQQAAAQQQSLEQSELGFASAQARYQAGSGDFLTVLDAERALILVRQQMGQYRLARLQAAVGLCKALGGGWRAQ